MNSELTYAAIVENGEIKEKLDFAHYTAKGEGSLVSGNKYIKKSTNQVKTLSKGSEFIVSLHFMVE